MPDAVPAAGEIPMSEQQNDYGGLPLNTFNRIMMCAGGLIVCLLLYATFRLADSYALMRSDTENYIARQQSAADMKTASDYLTEQVRCFAVTGDVDYLRNYFEEAEVTRRRDNALEALQDSALGEAPYMAMETAMAHSVELMGKGIHSMRPPLRPNGYDLTQFPEAIAGELTAADAVLEVPKRPSWPGPCV